MDSLFFHILANNYCLFASHRRYFPSQLQTDKLTYCFFGLAQEDILVLISLRKKPLMGLSHSQFQLPILCKLCCFSIMSIKPIPKQLELKSSSSWGVTAHKLTFDNVKLHLRLMLMKNSNSKEIPTLSFPERWLIHKGHPALPYFKIRSISSFPQ